MIQKLYIKNFAIIDEIDINFEPGLTVVTGETGSGKSILLEALGVALGAKADKIMVRNGAERAVVEAKFSDVEIRRIVYDSGRTKSYKDDKFVTLIDLKKENITHWKVLRKFKLIIYLLVQEFYCHYWRSICGILKI